MGERGIDRNPAAFYSHVLPALSPQAWYRSTLAGDGWMALGDAAGLVDPVTGEGLYYAVRSSDVAADALIKGLSCHGDVSKAYTDRLQITIVDDLAFGSLLAPRFFKGRLLFQSVPTQIIRFMRSSRCVKSIFEAVLTGYQPYKGIRDRLRQGPTSSLRDALIGFLLARVLPP